MVVSIKLRLKKMTVSEVKVGDVVKVGCWKSVISIKDWHLPDYKAYYRTLYFEDGSKCEYNIFENVQVC